MVEENKNISSSGIGGLDFFLFLILILIFIGNQNTFDEYFTTLDRESNRLNQIIQTFSSTAEALRKAFVTPQELKNNLEL